ncbi:MAG TPA: tetratricopeptide repeat protein [Candidatus Sulfotelmatobacter sp.]|jgi:tetratricopeptide (TPR) repeat protein|nr:tetratricopeptide repeat protein [Candidatus Sulfotelmatobacter sp.]
MPSAEDLFNQALDHHQHGRLNDAQAIYRAILDKMPGHADSLHLLGVVDCQRGDYAAAAERIHQAIALNGGNAAYHSNLGIALRELGRINEAEQSFRAALALNPDYAEALCNLGVALEELGRFTESEATCRQALELRPGYAEALLNLGMALKGQDRLEDAAASFRQAIAIAPRYAKAHCNLGVVLKELEQTDQALMSYGRALMIDPNSAETHLNLSNLLRDEERYEEALGACQEALRLKPNSPLAYMCVGNALNALKRFNEAAHAYAQAVRLKPDFAEAHSNMGNCLKEAGRFAEAEAACRTAVGIKPGYPQAHSNLGNVFKELNRLDDALACYETALACDPDYAQGHLNRGITRLLQGEMEAGWPDYEWRWKLRDWPQKLRHAEYPRWQGDAARGRTMLVWPEQGLGDLIHFIRYVPDLVRQGWNVVLESPTALYRLFARLDGVHAVPFGAPLPPFDVQCPLMSLAGLMPGQPSANPYLAAEPETTRAWADRLKALPGRKVGFAWRGNPNLARDRNRSLPAEAFAPLVGLAGITPVILQKDARDDELAALHLPDAHLVAGPELADFADTAALMRGLDLVVGVDTAVCHLAGALGRPVWTLLEFAPDWRWQLRREDSPWYPSMRLFRQSAPGNWPSVLDKVRRRLEQPV